MLNRTRLSSLDAFGLRDQRNRIYPALEASDGSTLSLAFTQMSNLTSSGFTLSRATGGGKVGTATYIDNTGYLVSASASMPRFEYDPTTLAPRGLLIEGESTNLLNLSETFATSGGTNNNWADTNLTRNSTNNTSPRNDATALRVTASAANGTLISTTAIGTTAQRTLSVWLRRVTGTGAIQYTLNNGTNWTTQAITSSWVRYTFAATTAAQQVGFRIVANDDAIEIWGAQLEAGAAATSYIPTTTATVTRAADKLSMTDISTIQWNQTAGTFLWDMDVQSETNTSSFPAFAGMYRAGPVRVIRFQLNNSSGTNPRIGGGTWTATPSALVADTFYTRSVATPFKAAVAFANTGQSMTYCINGTVQSTVTGTGTLATATLFLMHQDPSAADTEYFPIHLRQLKYWPTNLSSSDLRSITT